MTDFDQAAIARYEFVVMQAELVAMSHARRVHVHRFQHDEPCSAFGPRFAVIDVTLRDSPRRQSEILFHRRHDDPVADSEASDAAG